MVFNEKYIEICIKWMKRIKEGKAVLKRHASCVMLTAIIILVNITILTGCGQAEIPGDSYPVYYISAGYDGVVPSYYIPENASSTEELVEELIDVMQVVPEDKVHSADKSLIPSLDQSVGFKSATVAGSQVYIDFDSQVYAGDNISTVLMRAALTRTLTAIPEITAVCCTVDGVAMTDSAGKVIGPMTADMFIDNAGAQINPEEKTILTLYFANEAGDGLVKVKRSVVYSGNISMDKLVVEQLLEGPHSNESGYPVLGENVKVINVTTQDGTCYVNLSPDFLSPVNNITTDVALYSIVDSLIELGNINKVQFLIDSENDIMFRESVNLNTLLDRNLDIVVE